MDFIATKGENKKDKKNLPCDSSCWSIHRIECSILFTEIIANFHVGEMVLSLQKATLCPGRSESLVYTTVSGAIGILVPFTSHEDLHAFFQRLKMLLQSENPPLCGQDDHMLFRSYYFAVKNVIDGDLCEQFNSLEPSKQKAIANDLDLKPNKISKKLEDLRSRYAF